MFGKFKSKEKENKIKEENKPKYYNFLSGDVEEEYLKKYWADNNYQIPEFNSWEELLTFLKDNNKTLAQKMEVISNLDCNNSFFYDKEANPIPDYFWKDTSLDRRLRALCRAKSVAFSNMRASDYSNETDYYYDLCIKDLDNDLFLGFCEYTYYGLYMLFDSEKVTQAQKELIVRKSMSFKALYNKQKGDYSHVFVLLTALEKDCFHEDFKTEIYEKVKEIMLKTECRASNEEEYKNFFYRFYNDEKVSTEDKIKMINKYLPDIQGNNYSKKYLFYLGNKNIPAFIQRIVLNHFLNATGYNLEHSHPETFKNMDASSFVYLLSNNEIPDDLKVKLINNINNPLLLCYCMMDNSITDNIRVLLKVKLETLKVPETKEVLELIKTVLTADTESLKRCLKQE